MLLEIFAIPLERSRRRFRLGPDRIAHAELSVGMAMCSSGVLPGTSADPRNTEANVCRATAMGTPALPPPEVPPSTAFTHRVAASLKPCCYDLDWDLTCRCDAEWHFLMTLLLQCAITSRTLKTPTLQRNVQVRCSSLCCFCSVEVAREGTSMMFICVCLSQSATAALRPYWTTWSGSMVSWRGSSCSWNRSTPAPRLIGDWKSSRRPSLKPR